MNLYDIRMPESSDRLRLLLKPLPFVRPSIHAGQRHLESDNAVKSQVSGTEDDPHAAQTEHGLDVVSGDQR
jgi:hypothetical protein